MTRFRFGCSGWDYPEWVGPFYKSATESKLAAYCRVFDTVEINSTFYRPPTKGMVHGWARYTHDEFTFAAKVPQTVTHERLLDADRGATKELLDYCELMRPLLDAGKLGPLLLQLPPRLRFEPKRILPFLETLPPAFLWALEPRNKTWMVDEAFELLRTHGIVYTIVDEPLLPPTLKVTAKTAYIRWHGHGTDPWYDYHYSDPELQSWVPKVREVGGSAGEVYGFWNNHYHGYAPENCLAVLEMLGVELTPAQEGARRRIAEHRKGLVRTSLGTVRTPTLEEFSAVAPAGDPDVERLLAGFLDRGRLERARREDAASVEITSDEGTAVEARVREYGVQIDLSARTIVHDCEDWAKGMRDRRFCKHVARLFLTLPPGRAEVILRDLTGRREDWTFEVPSP